MIETKNTLEYALDNFTTDETRQLALHVMHGLVSHVIQLEGLETGKTDAEMAAALKFGAKMLRAIEQQIGRPTSGHFRSPLQTVERYVNPRELAAITKQNGTAPPGPMRPSSADVPDLPPHK